MRKMLLSGMGLFVIFSLCLSNSAYAAWGGLVLTKEERAEAIKQLKEVDLPLLRDRAIFYKQKIEGLQSKGQEKIDVEDPLIEGVDGVLRTMNSLHEPTELVPFVNSRGYSANHLPFKSHELKISQVILKLEEVIAIIDSVIGLGKTETQGK